MLLGLLLVVLGGLAACAPDAVTAPRAAAPAGPHAYLASTPGAYTQMDAGARHTCAVSTGGAVTCWGYNSYGQTSVPAGLSGVTQVSGGRDHTCAVSTGGALACWGNNVYGQASVPAGLAGVTQVSTGNVHTCAVSNGGTVTCWGLDAHGQTDVPAGLTGVTQVSAGAYYTCALGAGGAVTCWGENFYGQASVPAGLTGVTQVSAGEHHTCAVRTGGVLTCWGDNAYGQASVPAGLTGVTQVSTSYFDTCAVGGGGTVACWGDNSSGQASVPAGLTGVTQVSVGYFHTCALGTGGAVTCWGDNRFGGTAVPAPPPASTTRVLPTATFTAPSTTTAGQPFLLALTGAQVPGSPAATAFTYRFDCGDGAGYAAAAAAASASCPTTAAGPRAVRGQVIDQDGDTTSYAATVAVAKAAQTVAFASTAPSPAYVGATYAASAAATSGRPVTLSARTPATCAVAAGASPATPAAPATVRFLAAGACTLAADQAGDSVYAAAPSALQTVTVGRQAQVITVTSAPPSPALVGGRYAVAATGGASGNAVTFSSLTPTTCTVAGSSVGLVAAGPCTLAADQAGTDAYDAAPRQTQTFPVAAPAPAFPRTAVLDRFARANGALGSAWGGFTTPVFFQVAGQQGAVGLGGGIGWAAAAFGPTQEAFVTLSTLGSNGGSGAQGLVLKGQDPRAYTLGALTVTYQPQSGTVQVAALRTPPAAATAYPALAVRYAAGDQLGARATAAGAVEVYKNGALVGTVALSAGDRAYFAGRGGYVGLLYAGAPGARFDDFGGGSVAP